MASCDGKVTLVTGTRAFSGETLRVRVHDTGRGAYVFEGEADGVTGVNHGRFELR